MIPRGLHIQIFPSYAIKDEAFCNKWEETCTKCLNSLIQLIIDSNIQTLDLLGGEIETIEKQLETQISAEDMITYKAELDELAMGWEKQITAQKMKTFQIPT